MTPADRPPWVDALPRWTRVAASFDLVADVREQWTSRLSRHERGRVLALLRGSRGRPGTLDGPARHEWDRLTGQLDLRAVAGRTPFLGGHASGPPRGRGR